MKCLILKLLEERGWTRAELARRSGLSRQLIHNLETGATLPSIQTAFHLKRTFGCKFEELFEEEERDQALVVHCLDGKIAKDSRVNLARISDQWVAYPTDLGGDLTKGFSSADGIVVEAGKSILVRPLVSVEEASHNLAIAGCDPALHLLREALAKTSKIKVIIKSSNSQNSLELLSQGLVHIAGVHFKFHGLGSNPRVVASAKYPRNTQAIQYSIWEQGWVVAPGNPKRFGGIEDLTRRDIRFINREEGSGTRWMLDNLLKKSRVPVAKVSGFKKMVNSHLACAQEVAEGRADVGLTLQAMAVAMGLHFIPVSRVSFDLVIPKEFLNHPSVQVLTKTLQSKSFQKNLSSLPGYSSEQTGSTLN